MDVSIHYVDLPPKVNAVSTVNEDGSYSVFVNPAASAEQQKRSGAHELAHIAGNDFDCVREVSDLEQIVHRLCS